jgi:hypothetical protein
LAEHTLGRGARLTQVQREAGGTWIVADVQPGTRDREQQLKERGAARRCGVCKAIADYQAGQLSQPEALARAGWAHATPHERGLLLEMFELEQAPEGIPEQAPETRSVRSAPEIRPITPAPGPQIVEATPELEALVDALEERWRREAQAELGAGAEHHPAADADLTAPGPEAEPAADWLQGPDGAYQARHAGEAEPSADTYQARHAAEAEPSGEPQATRPEYLGWTGSPEVRAGRHAAAEADLADVADVPARTSLPGGPSRARSRPTPELQVEIPPEIDAQAEGLFWAVDTEPELELELG